MMDMELLLTSPNRTLQVELTELINHCRDFKKVVSTPDKVGQIEDGQMILQDFIQ